MAIAFDDDDDDSIVAAVVDWVVVLRSHGARSAGDRPLRRRVFGSVPSPSVVVIIIILGGRRGRSGGEADVVGQGGRRRDGRQHAQLRR